MIILQDIETGFCDYDRHFKLVRDNIYAGCVVTQNKKGKEIPCRKILFALNEDGTVNDLLYDSPNYKIESDDKFTVKHIVKLEALLKYLKYNEFLYDYQIYKIYRKTLYKNQKIFKNNPANLPLTLKEYATLDMISFLNKKPTIQEKKEVEKFKTKIKTYTFR